ncbi:hypothetical protein EOS_16725 [Caballeronia mineralivorans PML1(12)]|uniref:DUF4325 domain-containing protein n=1 Tax=Caballeronia mineralivorans PML1(12) TaxID=908627 RepID=A0A0J1CX23_9BURK|nr:STAS-like domain-containing protein [Caballeronia mineralivorans]KLU25077.1 hypothetical protein EOS_16725 [Caballeronia mineralivorans PML1(12)]
MHIFIKDLVGANALTMTDGQKVFDAIHPNLKRDEAVILDFEGVNIFATPFFNAAVGRLLSDLSSDVLRDRLIFRNLSPLGSSVLRRVIENAKEYYGSTAAGRKIVDDAIADPHSHR